MGKPKITQEKIIVIMSFYESKEYTINDIIKMTGVVKGPIYNMVNRQKSEANKWYDDNTFGNRLHYNSL